MTVKTCGIPQKQKHSVLHIAFITFILICMSSLMMVDL